MYAILHFIVIFYGGAGNYFFGSLVAHTSLTTKKKKKLSLTIHDTIYANFVRLKPCTKPY